MGCGLLKVAAEYGIGVVSKDKKELAPMTQTRLKSMYHKNASEHEVLGTAKYP